MIIATKTDTGLQREVNQDSFAAGEIRGRAWATVCDGMGGAKGGSVASTAAVKRISDIITQSLNGLATASYLRSSLRSALENANKDVFLQSQKNPDCSGMGTTSVTLIVADGMAYYANVGDSRLYLLRGGELSQLTTDHSVVQSMVEKGEITPNEAKNHPKKNVITRAIGVESEISVDLGECQLYNGDVLLLCTDGLTNYVETCQILQIMNENEAVLIPEKLISAANNGGGGDNITAVVIKV